MYNSGCLMLLKDSSNQWRVVNLSEIEIKLFKNTQLGEFFSNDDSIQVNGLFKSSCKPNKSRSFPDGDSCNIRGDRLEEKLVRPSGLLVHEAQSSIIKNSNDLSFCDKPKHKITVEKGVNLKDASYGSKSFEKRRAINKFVEDPEKVDLVESTCSCWAAPSIK